MRSVTREYLKGDNSNTGVGALRMLRDLNLDLHEVFQLRDLNERLDVSEELTRKELEKIGQRVIAQEHDQMPKTCNKCGGKMEFTMQSIISKPVIGDMLVYECEKCGNAVEKFFEFPEEYVKRFS